MRKLPFDLSTKEIYKLLGISKRNREIAMIVAKLRHRGISPEEHDRLTRKLRILLDEENVKKLVEQAKKKGC